MSVSITHKQVFLDVAATMAFLAQSESMSGPARSLRLLAIELADSLNIKLQQDIDVVGAEFYNVFLQANAKSLEARYPDNPENARQTAQPESRIDVMALRLPLQSMPRSSVLSDALCALHAKVERLRHGLHDETDHPEISTLDAALGRFSAATTQSLVWANKPSGTMPSINQLAESLTRLQANGDYLYGEQSALSSLARQLQAMSNQLPEYGGLDTLLTLYKQAYEQGSFNLPFGEKEWDLAHVRDHRLGNYSVSGDIPYAVQADADRVNIALIHINNDLHLKPLLDTEFNKLSDEQQHKVKLTFSRFAHNHLTKSQELRFEPYYNYAHLSFDEAQKAIAQAAAPSFEYWVVSRGEPKAIPSEETVGGHPQDPVRIRQLRALCADGSAIVRKDTGDWDAIQQMIPDAKAVTFGVNKEENRAITRGYALTVQTAAEFALRSAITQVYRDMGLPDRESIFSVEQVARQVNNILKKTLPGFGDDSLAALIKGISDVSRDPATALRAINDHLPEHLSSMLKTPGVPTLATPKPQSAPVSPDAIAPSAPRRTR